MNLYRPILSIVVFAFLLMPSCKKDEGPTAEEQRTIDETAIQKYLSDRDWESTRTSSGLHYIIEEEGNGLNPTITSTVTVNYVGKLTNGEIFDQNTNGPVSFPLQGVIRGWQEGIPFFSEGGSGVLLIPSHLGYGPAGSGGVPPNSVMVFEIDLLMVE